MSSNHADNGDEESHEDAPDSLGTWSVDPRSVEGLFLAALQKEPVDREAFLAEAAGGDEHRRQRVQALLRAFEDAGSFLETPAVQPHSAEEISLRFLRLSEKEGCLGTLGAYEVAGVIGRGGMGIVLDAFDPKLNRVVAIKVLLPELAASGNARRRFLREARAAAAISHPHVVTIHAVEEASQDDAGDEPPVPPYLVMERVAGQSLQQKLERFGPLGVQETLRIARQIAEGLTAAHRQGVVHRDIKPANILLENGVERVKITDFGLARAIDDVTVTRTGELSGTPQYMSPEQASGEQVDHRSDLFSLGCVMYAMCTGHSPFRADSLAHAIKRVTQDLPRAIRQQNPDVPFWLVELIDSLLQKDPSKRPQNAQQVAALFEQHLALIQQAAASDSHALVNRSVLDTPPRRTEPSPVVRDQDESKGRRLQKTMGALFWLGMALVIGGLAQLWVLVNYPMMLQNDPLIESNAHYYCLAVIGSGILLVVAGTILRADNRGIPVPLLMLYIVLGPLGLILWLIHRDLRQPGSGSRHALAGSTPAAAGSPSDAIRLVDSTGESSHAKVGRYLILGGLYVLLQPWFLILVEPVVADSALMQLGGSLVGDSFFIGLLAISLGYILRYIVDSEQDRHRPLRPSLAVLVAGLIAVIAAAAIAVSQHWMAGGY